MMFITLNPNYILKPDEGCTLMMAKLVGRNLLNGIDDSFTNVIHPIYAMILSYIDGGEYNECVKNAADEIGVSYDLVEQFVSTLLDNPDKVYLKHKDAISSFPPYTIISTGERTYNKRYTPELFDYEVADVRMKRHFTPSSITLMLNNVCVTNCIYCYQDQRKKVQCSIPLDRIMEIIQEAYKLHVNTIDVIGGEFFLYKHWKELLQELRKYGYNPYISTKMPLSEEDVKFLSEVKIHDIQVSLDTAIEDHLISSIGVKSGYVDKMLDSLLLLDKYSVPVKVHSVLTKYNDSIEDMRSLFDILKKLNNIVDWHLVKGDPSLYPKADYKDIEIETSKMNELIRYITNIKQTSDFFIQCPEIVITESMQSTENVSDNKENTENPISKFLDRSFCSGLYSSLYILPDGQVTICEQLYWNKTFIVGNVLNQSLSEIWNSEKAKSIFFIRQEDIPADSLCRTCDIYNVCRPLKQVCYREIIRKYGADKWYYPDVDCPYSQTKNR